MNRNPSFLSLLGGAVLSVASFPAVASAQNPNFAHGDLVLTLQQEGGSKTIYANLGNAAVLFRGSASGPGAANMINFKNISAELTAAYGGGWASDATIYAGLAGVWGTSQTNGTALQDGDPHRTLYVSASRSGVGTLGQANSAGYLVNTNGGMTTGAQDMRAMNNWFEINSVNSVQEADVSVSLIDDQNPFLAEGLQDTAYEIFGGGVQQVGTAGTFGSFGDAGTVEFALDLYRIVARNDVAGQVDGPVREGTYEGTITINSSGQVSFISQGAAGSNYDSWMDAFASITDENDKLPGADPDQDGLSNLMEFVLNGDPSASDTDIAPTLDASGSNFVFAFDRNDDAITETTVVFQYGSDLSGWTDATISAGGGVVGDATISVTDNGTTDAVSVTVPKSVAPGGKLFGRLKVTK